MTIEGMNSWIQIIDTPGTAISRKSFTGDGTPLQGGILIRAPGCLIDGCSFQNLTGIGVAMTGICERTIISDCDFGNIGMQAIAFMDGTGDCSDSFVIGNRISTTGYDSISIGGSGRITVRDNRVYGSNDSGIYALTGTRNARIDGNVVTDSFGGIDVSWTVQGGSRAGQDLTGGNIITGNRIMRCSGGIGTASNGTIISNNVVTDSGAPSSGYLAGTRPVIPNGIGITDASYCVVTGNISGNIAPNASQLYGFLMRRIFERPSDNRIEGNNFWFNSESPAAGWYANKRADTVLSDGGNIIKIV